MAKMKLNLKKIDLTRLKQFLLHKGEKVALITALAIGALLVGRGILSARSIGYDKGQRFLDVMQSGVQKVKGNIENPPTKIAESPAYQPPQWVAVISTFPFGPLMSFSEVGDFKRRNPNILAVPGNDANRTNIQIDYLQGAALSYDFERERQMVSVVIPPNAGTKAAGSPAVTIRPKRMIVTEALFPIKDQLNEYAKALRMPLSDLLLQNPRLDWPRFLGVNVVRIETDDKGNPVETKLYQYDPKMDKIHLAPHLEQFFQEMLVDEEGLKAIENHRYPNLLTPVPRMANAVYPKLKLDGLKLVEMAVNPDEEKNPVPKVEDKRPKISIVPDFGKKTEKDKEKEKPPEKPDIVLRPFKKLENEAATKDLIARFSGIFNAFDPLAGPPQQEKIVNVPQQPMPGQPNVIRRPEGLEPTQIAGKDPNPGQPLANVQVNDGLIRFIDVDVEPGKTYRYKFQVRVLSPNYKRSAADLATQSLAEIKELLSPWTTTPSVSIPLEQFMYAVDQIDVNPTDPKKSQPRGPDLGKLDEGGVLRAPVQIHRWFGKATDREGTEHLIGDWVIAERLLVRRGEYIGRREAVVQSLTWSKARGNWENPNVMPAPKKPKEKAPTGIPLDFTLGSPAPLLVDFDGGPRNFQNRTVGLVKEDAAMDLLILTPEGKLIVRNTHEDSDDPQRVERYDAYRNRVDNTPEYPKAPFLTPGQGGGAPAPPGGGR